MVVLPVVALPLLLRIRALLTILLLGVLLSILLLGVLLSILTILLLLSVGVIIWVVILKGMGVGTFPNLLKEGEELGLGDPAVALDVDGGEKLPHFKLIEPSRLIEGGIELVEEVVDLFELERATPVVVVDLEDLVDVHPQDVVVHGNLK